MTPDEYAGLRRKLDAAIATKMEAMFTPALCGTSTVDRAPPSLTADDLTRLANQMRVWQRDNLYFIVRQGYDGPILGTQHPDGKRIEISWRQAQAVHEQWPLVLHEIVSEDEAVFRPAISFDRFVPKTLPMPPYEVPQARDGNWSENENE